MTRKTATTWKSMENTHWGGAMENRKIHGGGGMTSTARTLPLANRRNTVTGAPQKVCIYLFTVTSRKRSMKDDDFTVNAAHGAEWSRNCCDVAATHVTLLWSSSNSARCCCDVATSSDVAVALQRLRVGCSDVAATPRGVAVPLQQRYAVSLSRRRTSTWQYNSNPWCEMS